MIITQNRLPLKNNLEGLNFKLSTVVFLSFVDQDKNLLTLLPTEGSIGTSFVFFSKCV